MQKLRLAEKEATRIPVFVQLFTKSLPEKKMLDSLCRFLVELLASNGEIMFCKSVNGKFQLIEISFKLRRSSGYETQCSIGVGGCYCVIGSLCDGTGG